MEVALERTEVEKRAHMCDSSSIDGGTRMHSAKRIETFFLFFFAGKQIEASSHKTQMPQLYRSIRLHMSISVRIQKCKRKGEMKPNNNSWINNSGHEFLEHDFTRTRQNSKITKKK